MTNTFLGGIKLPINPLEEVSFSVSGENKSFSIVSLGEISELGNRKQISLSIKSLFVNSDIEGFDKGVYVDEILTMINQKEPVRFIITGDGFDTNMLVSIESFKYSLPYGEGGDVYYSLSLKEYRKHKAKVLVIKNVNSTSSSDSTALTDSKDYSEKRKEVSGNA